MTYDYELFFGNPTGSVEKCIIEPTNHLRTISKETGAKMVFFIDVGYLKKMQEFIHFEIVNSEYQLVVNQIENLVSEGHDCQLHIHPHWEDSYHDGEKWIMNVNRYKLVDFDEDDIIKIVLEYQSILSKITNKKVDSYRAGGWCLQPFSKVEKAFSKAGLKIDSTVFPQGKNTKGNYYYDFSSTPDKDCWRFSNDLCQEVENGEFLEIPISNYNYSPFFFWKLFILGRLDPKNHKPMGNGYPMPSPGMKKSMLTKGLLLSASVDGYFVQKLDSVIKRNEKKNFKHTVIIGHPKACTKFALKKLKRFILNQQKRGHQFSIFSQ